MILYFVNYDVRGQAGTPDALPGCGFTKTGLLRDLEMIVCFVNYDVPQAGTPTVPAGRPQKHRGATKRKLYLGPSLRLSLQQSTAQYNHRYTEVDHKPGYIYQRRDEWC